MFVAHTWNKQVGYEVGDVFEAHTWNKQVGYEVGRCVCSSYLEQTSWL